MTKTGDDRIWLIQWLCSARHCAMAVPFVPLLGQTAEATISTGQRLAREQGLRAVCGICGGAIAPESLPTRFHYSEWEAFVRAMHAAQTDQLWSRAALDALGVTVDSQRERQN